MASFCYVCGTATPAGLDRNTGEAITITTRSGIGPADLVRKLQRALGPGYELQDRIGAGGFAEVFRARDLRLKRDLAVKVLRPDLGLSPDLLQRFRREAETIATLRNAHIVPVFDIGEAEGLAFIMMPLISGESLRAVLDRDGQMAPAEVRRILREAALGLAAAHDAGVIHRDIKPENIMLEGREKRVLLMDFGISKAVGAAGGEDGDPGQTLTTTGIIIGTPQYMSPEQACGDKTIDARTDQYSLAVVAYRMLAGGLPFEGESTRAVLYQQLVAEPPPISTKVAGVPPGLARAIQRAMAKEPNARFANMLDFAAEIGNDADDPAPAAVAPRPVRVHRRASPAIALMAAAAVVVIVGAFLMVARRPHSPAPIPSVATTITPPPPPADTTPKVEVAPPVTRPALTRPGAATTRNTTGTGGSASNKTPGSTSATAPTPATPTLNCAKLAAAANWIAAVPVCTHEAESGNASSQRILGTMYDKGTGESENPGAAVSWYRKAAPSDPEAKFLLSRMLEIGRGVPADPEEATHQLRESATAGWVRAQQTLAYRLENGAGIKKDKAEAADWYRKAADKGDAISQQRLAALLAKGDGIPKDEASALEYYKKAGAQSVGDAAWQASQMYFKGKGTDKDENAGMEWLRKAAALNQPDAIRELKKRGGG
jgi:serine/threonine protein kinase